MSPVGERKPADKMSSSYSYGSVESAQNNTEISGLPTILIRKLPSKTGEEALRSMLIFAKDLLHVDFVDPKYHEDKGFASAIAQFASMDGAYEAQERLHGKPNAAKDANLTVELVQHGIPVGGSARRGTIDSSASRNGSTSTSSSTNGHATRLSRYDKTFQAMEKMSPPNGVQALGSDEFSSGAKVAHLFSPTSPLSNSPQNRGKSLITDDAGEGNDDQLLRDPVAYAKSGQSTARRPTNPQIPVTRFATLSLTTSGSSSVSSPPMSNFASPRSAAPVHSPASALTAMSPASMASGLGSSTPNATYSHISPQYPRHNYPPVNPADQNPPCNTLYVGNLPIDTSEDELKAVFSKQRGYKRLCFRTKQNGPMCFVEFEDVSFATKALNELYGHPLHNSVKGGIRLSFSKNPLGVRTGQTGNMGQSAALPPQPVIPGFSASSVGAPHSFSTATGPPPGLAPPGLAPMSMNPSPSFAMYGNGGFGMAGNAPSNTLRTPIGAGVATTAGAGSGYAGYSEFMMGR